MKKLIKRTLFILLGLPFLFIVISFLLTYITVNNHTSTESRDKTIYLSTNGVHLDIIIPKRMLPDSVLLGLKYSGFDQYLAFGWGDENFYLNTPTWGDLTFSNAFNALFLKSTSLMHVTRYPRIRSRWQEVKVNDKELEKLVLFIHRTFSKNEENKKIILEGKGTIATMISMKPKEVIFFSTHAIHG